MTININNRPTFGCAAQKSAVNAARKSFAPVLSDLPDGIVIESRFITSLLRKINRNISAPEQRLIMGVTALFSQPFIDLNNNRVNEETRLMSFSRTLAKIVVGTTVGVLVRKGCIKLANNYSNIKTIKKSAESGVWGVKDDTKSCLAPDYVRTYIEDYHRNYVNALGSLLGVTVSVFTNFLIDAPLTQLMTNGIYKKVSAKKKQAATKKPRANLLIEAKKKLDAKNKKVSFSGNIASKTLKGVQKITEQKIAKGAKYIPDENSVPVFQDWREIKRRIWIAVTKDPSKILIHTGALGWAASSAAQITGIAFNDKIDSNKKKFLIPQEFADAGGNIALYYLITVSVKRWIDKLFETGKIRIKSVMDKIQVEGNRIDKQLGNIFDGNMPVQEHLKEFKNSRKSYLAYKNGAMIFATLCASVLSCNILTPYIRNIYGAYMQQRKQDKSAEINAELFDMAVDSNRIKNDEMRKRLFGKFII